MFKKKREWSDQAVSTFLSGLTEWQGSLKYSDWKGWYDAHVDNKLDEKKMKEK